MKRILAACMAVVLVAGGCEESIPVAPPTMARPATADNAHEATSNNATTSSDVTADTTKASDSAPATKSRKESPAKETSATKLAANSSATGRSPAPAANSGTSQRSKYQPVQGVSGTIKSVGSDTMNNLMTLWLEGFKKIYPAVQFEMEGKGTSTAMPALIAGTAHFGPMSRDPKGDEISSFTQAFGYEPTVVPTCLDVLAVYVHKDNPIAQRGLTLQQVDAIFSKNRNGGWKTDIRTWGDLGLTGEWADKPISLNGRNSASGTYGYFKENALFKGDFKDSVKEQPGSSAVIQAIASDRYAIGYSGIGYKTADVAIVPLAASEGANMVPAEERYAMNGEYPLARYLLLAVNKDPNEPLDPLRAEFLRYTLSEQGQSDVVKDGYIPLPPNLATKMLTRLGLQK